MARGSVRAAFPFLSGLFGPFPGPGEEPGAEELPDCRNAIALRCSWEEAAAVPSLPGLRLAACVHRSFVRPSTLRRAGMSSVQF